MIGVRAGVTVGMRAGVAVGVPEDELGVPGTDPLAGVSRDASSSVYVPANGSEWTTLMNVAGVATGNPSTTYLCQEASGNLADSIGTFTLAASGTGLLYQQTISGWTRKAVGTTTAGTGVFANADAGLPNIATNSILLMMYVQPTTIATRRDIIGFGAAATKCVAQNEVTTGFARALCNSNIGGPGAVNMGGSVHPWVLQANRTASTCTLYTDVEKITPAFSAAIAGQSITVGTFIAGCATARYLYGACWFNSAAEMTSGQVKAVLQTLGWTIPWS